MDIEIRLERREERRAVEELTREAFWNLHAPGCDEHLLAHRLREHPDFIPALDFVALLDGHVAGNIMFARASVMDERGVAHAVVTFGPVSVLPAVQKRGIGAALIRHALKTAAEQGHGAVLIYGDPAYYRRFGFRSARVFGIRTSKGEFLDALMALELIPGALDNVSGRFLEGPAYAVDKQELDEFDRTFPYREKRVTGSQRRFERMSRQE